MAIFDYLTKTQLKNWSLDKTLLEKTRNVLKEELKNRKKNDNK